MCWKYSQPCILVGSASVNSTSHGLKIFGGESRKFQKAKPKFAAWQQLFT